MKASRTALWTGPGSPESPRIQARTGCAVTAAGGVTKVHVASTANSPALLPTAYQYRVAGARPESASWCSVVGAPSEKVVVRFPAAVPQSTRVSVASEVRHRTTTLVGVPHCR